MKSCSKGKILRLTEIQDTRTLDIIFLNVGHINITPRKLQAAIINTYIIINDKLIYN